MESASDPLSQVDFVSSGGQSANQTAKCLTSGRCSSGELTSLRARCGKHANPKGWDGSPRLCDLSFERPQCTFYQDGAIVLHAFNARIEDHNVDQRRAEQDLGAKAK